MVEYVREFFFSVVVFVWKKCYQPAFQVKAGYLLIAGYTVIYQNIKEKKIIKRKEVDT